MSSFEDSGRSPMASRRVRRHAMGVSNVHSVYDGASSISRSTVSLIRADKLVKVPQHLRPSDPAARETRVEDRPLVNRVHDKLFNTHRERYVRKVLQSCSGAGSGLLSRAQLRTALQRLNVGLDRDERERIIARVAPEEDSEVHYLEFMRVYDIPQPLGDEAVAVARGMSVPGPPVVRPGGGGCGIGDGGKSYWSWQRHASARMPGLLDGVREGSSEQARSDALLTGLMVSKLGNCRDKLRAIFREMDANRNSVIDREEFANGVAKLRIDVSRQQVDRLFDMCDTDRNGVIDYTEFAQRFEEPGLLSSKRVNMAGVAPIRSSSTSTGGSGTNGTPLAQAMALSPDELQGALRHPLVLELARSLHGKGNQARAPFKRLDLPRSGLLDVRNMTAACQALVPGIGERQVAAVMAAMDPQSGGHADYRSFIARVEGGLSHPRMAHSAPPGGKGKDADSSSVISAIAAAAAGPWSGSNGEALGALARFGEPLTVPAPLSTSHTRALSAVSLSRRTDGDADGDATSSADGSGSGSGSSTVPPPPPPALSKRAPDRDSLYTLHAVAVRPFLESLDEVAAAAGERAHPLVSRSFDVTGSDGTTGSNRAPSHSTGRFSRFWSKHYADTTSITSADPASSMYTLPNGPFVRKGENDEYLHYQREDRAKEARRRGQLVQRHIAHSEADTRYSAQDDASGADDGRLEVARAAKHRYEERCDMYDRLRHVQDKGDHAFFARLPVFSEHKSDAANLPVWSDQTKTYC
ncbi:hypothetical protein VaNZ11_002561 [Volvox africanus]|uniref:EF-hand domain-containing protein n=1 Tax=Volvox africanus TaxID=51714 RepID=A0ABQ5RS89_9CHLO|nr:hypothetical protein VaNZ11_002561 [Volvox africanus]